jgi:hypothetical protein
MVERGRAWHGTDIEKDADIGFEHWPKCVENPSMGIDLLLVSLFQAKYNLNGCRLLLRADFSVRRYRDCRTGLKTGLPRLVRVPLQRRNEGHTLAGIFVDVGCDRRVIDRILCDTPLVCTHTREER